MPDTRAPNHNTCNMSPHAPATPAVQRLRATAYQVYAMKVILASSSKAADTLQPHCPRTQKLLEENMALRAETDRLKRRRSKEEELCKTVRRLNEQVERQRLTMDLLGSRATREREELQETAKRLLIRQKVTLDEKRERELSSLNLRVEEAEAEAAKLRTAASVEAVARGEQQHMIDTLQAELKQVEDSLLDASEWDVYRGRELRRRISVLDHRILELQAEYEAASKLEQERIDAQITQLKADRQSELLHEEMSSKLHTDIERLKQELTASQQQAAADLKHLSQEKDREIGCMRHKIEVLEQDLERKGRKHERTPEDVAQDRPHGWFAASSCDNEAGAACIDAGYFHRLGLLGGGEVSGRNYSQTACYETSLTLDPCNSECWNHLGVAGGGVVSGEHRTQTDCYQKAVEHNELNLWAWNNLAYVGGGEVNGQVLSKLDCYQKCVELDETDARAWRKIGLEGGGHVHGRFFSQSECFGKSGYSF